MDYIKINEFKERLKNELTEKRYLHTMSTVEKALQLAQNTDADIDAVYMAALLHDCAKYRTPTPEQQEILCDFAGYDAIIHAPLGAIIAKEEYGICDQRILNAIKYHTTGRYGMSIEEMIVCLADAIEDLRDYPGLSEIKKATEISIKDGLTANLKNVIKYESMKGNKIHHLTYEAVDYLESMV